MAKKVILDAGHGGYDNGARYGNRAEKDDALQLALAVGEILRNNGIQVAYTRTEDVYQSPVEKARIANEMGGDLFVSIHRNSGEIPNNYSGIETLIYNYGGLKEEAARNINEELAELGFRDIGVTERKNLAVLRRTNMPAVLVEAGFINSDYDNAIFDSRFYEVANAIAEGILDTFEEEDDEED